jgi:thiosulfate/3-mercaptopyruvate sulfurtransferase
MLFVLVIAAPLCCRKLGPLAKSPPKMGYSFVDQSHHFLYIELTPEGGLSILKNPRRGEKKMEKRILFVVPAVILVVSFLIAGYAYAKHVPPWIRTIDPIASTEWLEANSGLQNLVILDIRGGNDYAAGHIPNAINVPFTDPFSSEWVVSNPNGLWLQLPEKAALFNTIGSRGIKKDSLVVIVTAPNPSEPPYYGLANATRVADTLIYAGVRDVAILDGGYPKWVAESRPTTTEAPAVEPVTYYSKVNEEMFVSIEYVRKHIGRAVIIDARDAEVYFGAATEFFAPMEGHIPTARSLPTPWIWKLDSGSYIYKDTEILSAMASGVIGKHKAREIIIYCGVGGYASSWWYVLTQVLGYNNVKIFDGSAQEWVTYYDMVPYQWD